MKTQRIFFARLLIIFCLIPFIVGCASVSYLYNKARELDTIEAYEEFIQKYPDSKLANEAKKRIEELEASKKDFETAKTKNTIESYNEFIIKHPESEYVKEAKLKIREISLRKKNINDVIKIFIDHGLKGEYISDDTPTPFIECGVFKGDSFASVVVKFEDWISVYPLINNKAQKANIDVSCYHKLKKISPSSQDNYYIIPGLYNGKATTTKHYDDGTIITITATYTNGEFVNLKVKSENNDDKYLMPVGKHLMFELKENGNFTYDGWNIISKDPDFVLTISQKDKLVTHANIGPFAMIIVLQSKLLENKRDDILKALREW